MTFYVTTPIYYVNAEPHVGHAYTTIAADVLARYHRQRGTRSYFLTGTDEHGSKIAEAAAAAGEDPQAFTDRIAERFRAILPSLGVEPDHFIRTTDPEHTAFVRQVATTMHERGDIYESVYSGWYCTGCERYFTGDELVDGELCPIHKRPVEHMEETNWFFRLSAYKERLLEHFRANPDWIRPRTRYNEALALIDQLEDLSISRSSITWGVEVPWDPSQVFYVWIDALFNYRSALEYGDGASPDLWPPTTQLLAKDILKFHAVYWPAFLMSVGMELPRQLFIHGYLTAGGEKMGKSMGNALDPFPLVERFGPDPLRFYLFREVHFGQDGAVSMEGFERRYEGELANDLGNLVSRTAAMLVKYVGSDGSAAVPPAPGGATADGAEEMLIAWAHAMDSTDLTGALEHVWSYVRTLNRHVEVRAPWTLAKDDAQAQLLADTLAELVEGILAVAHALTPFMPATSARIAEVFGTSQEELHAWTWGSAAGRTVTRPEPLFPRIEPVVAVSS